MVIYANRVANRGPQVDLIPGDIFKADTTRTTIGGGVNGAYIVIANAVKVGFRRLPIPEQRQMEAAFRSADAAASSEGEAGARK